MAINPNTYYTVQGWFVTDLGLKGNELATFAIIYGFSQDGQSKFNGSVAYLCDWLGSSRRAQIYTLKKLVDKGLILKEPGEVYGINANRYTANFATIEKMRAAAGVKTAPEGVQNLHPGSAKTAPEGVQNLHPGSAKTAPDNYLDNNNNIYLDKESVKTPSVPYEKIKDLFNKTCKSYSKITALSNERKKAIKARFEQYGLEKIEQVFNMAEGSSFLKGDNDRKWKANFDWLMKDANFAKVLDGNYNNPPAEDPADDFVQWARRNPPTIDEDDLLEKSKYQVPIFKKGANGVLVDKSIDNSDLPWEIGG